MKLVFPIKAERCRALLLALAIDALLGDPPETWHPVATMGRWLALGEQLAPGGKAARLAWGSLWLGGGLALSAGAARLLPPWLPLQGAAASTLLAYRGLDLAASEVQAALSRHDLAEARRLLGWHLVSRPTAELRADEVAAATIESLAENLSDSLVAPLLAYLLGGLPMLAAYRFSNTADAMWGYRNERFEHLGKTAARLDDLLNLVPARLSALLIALAAQAQRRRGWPALQVAYAFSSRTASPNAGWPMAAMAGALDTTLRKRDHYTLGDGSCLPDADMIGAARRIIRLVVVLLLLALATAGLERKHSRE
jgi:adenosylcobinamide-phosphate synthase